MMIFRRGVQANSPHRLRRSTACELQQVLLSRLVSAGILGLLMLATPAYAAEKMVITYGPLRATLAVEDLATLVETGEASNSLKFYLNLAGLDPQVLRSLLAMELGASRDFMTGMLNSESGEHLLTQISEVVHLPPDRPAIQMLKSDSQGYREPLETENIEALRTALTEAAADRQVTVLDVLQHYPTEKVYVDAVKLIRFANRLNDPDLNNAATNTSEPEPSSEK